MTIKEKTLKTGEALKINREDAKEARKAFERLQEEGEDPRFYDDFSEIDFSKKENGDNLNSDPEGDNLGSELENVRKEIQNSDKQDKISENDYISEFVDDSKDKNSWGETQMSRRKFLQRLGIGAVAVGAGASSANWFSKVLERLNTKKHRQEDNREEEKPQDKNISEESLEESPEKEIRIENIADHYLRAYYELSKDPEKFPGDIFETDLLLAQQCQESGGKINAKSPSGAVGVLQNMTISIVDVNDYLNKLGRKTNFKWDGPKKLSTKQIQEIKKLLIKKSNYSRAFGKIYLMQLWDNENGYGVGRKRYKEGDIESTQIELMGAYNAGYNRVKDKRVKEWKRRRKYYKKRPSESDQVEYRAYNEVVTYVDRIMNYKTRIRNIRKIIEGMDILFDENENLAVREIALILNNVGVQGKERKAALERETRKYLTLLKNINIKYNRAVSDKEIKKYVPVKRS